MEEISEIMSCIEIMANNIKIYTNDHYTYADYLNRLNATVDESMECCLPFQAVSPSSAWNSRQFPGRSWSSSFLSTLDFHLHS